MLQKLSKRGNVPLPLIEIAQTAPYNLIAGHTEQFEKRAAGGNDGHIQIKDDERVENRVANALRHTPAQITRERGALPVGDIVKNQKQTEGFVPRCVDLAAIQSKATMHDLLHILFLSNNPNS